MARLAKEISFSLLHIHPHTMAAGKGNASRGGGSTIAPLTNSTKLFLQRLLVAHVVTDDEAQKLYDSIKSKFAHVVVVPPTSNSNEDGMTTDHGYMGNNLDHCFGIINASLVPGFELEVRTVSLLLPTVNNDDNNNDNTNNNKRQKLTRFHCITNNTHDNIAQVSAYPISKGGPHEMAYFRLVIERIIERGNEIILNDDDDDNNNHNNVSTAGGGGGVGCPGMLNKMELINLRTELDEGHKDKLSIEMTELALQCLIDEKWLVRVVAPTTMTQQGVDDEEEEKDDGNMTGKKRGRKSNSRKSSSSSSLKGTYYGIGPRTFMECSEFLQKAGLASERMPQSILHRI